MGGRIAKKFYVAGRVQGVGFRNFAQSAARELGVRGWARNLEDGRVEVLAIGTGRQLEKLEGELRVGPPRAEVRHLEAEDPEVADVKMEGFHIR